VLRTVAGLSHETKTRHRRGRTGRQPNRGQPPSTKAEKIADKNVLWKPCGAGGDKRASFEHNRMSGSDPSRHSLTGTSKNCCGLRSRASLGGTAQNRKGNKAESFASKFGGVDERRQFFEVPLLLFIWLLPAEPYMPIRADRYRMTHLCHAAADSEKHYGISARNRLTLFGSDVCPPNYLRPLFGVVGDELSELGGPPPEAAPSHRARPGAL
jgi:hypothetical protein